ncbi:MAG: DUF5596 domain-containing protein [Clostridiales bacterium]|nr:DUF5596 domain-containing protein [Clostridiales bacterium]
MTNRVLHFCDILHFPQDHTQEIKAVLDDIASSPERTAIFTEWSCRISQKDMQAQMVNIFQEDAETLGIHHSMWALLCMLNVLPLTQEYYETRGIPKEIMLDTLKDFLIWTTLYKEQTGRLGLFESNWLTRHILCDIFRLGRLQFEFGDSVVQSNGDDLHKGDKILFVHIPRDGRMDHGECKKSYALAVEFFARYFPDYDYKGFLCNSWILDTRLKAYLPEDSNIIRFQNDYTILESGDDPKTVLKHVFKKAEECLDMYPQNTTLEKAVISHLKSGKQLGYGIGFIPKMNALNERE